MAAKLTDNKTEFCHSEQSEESLQIRYFATLNMTKTARGIEKFKKNKFLYNPTLDFLELAVESLHGKTHHIEV